MRPTEVFLRHYFQRFGTISDVVIREYLCHNDQQNRQEGYGFITFEHAEAASAAAKECSSVLLQGIVVNATLNDRVRGGAGARERERERDREREREKEREATSSSVRGGIAFQANANANANASGIASTSVSNPMTTRSGGISSSLSAHSQSFIPANASSNASLQPEISASNSLEIDLMHLPLGRSISWDRSHSASALASASSVSMHSSLHSVPSLQAQGQTHSHSFSQSYSRSHSQSHSHSNLHTPSAGELYPPQTRQGLMFRGGGGGQSSTSPLPLSSADNQMVTLEELVAVNQQYRHNPNNMQMQTQRAGSAAASSAAMSASFSFDFSDTPNTSLPPLPVSVPTSASISVSPSPSSALSHTSHTIPMSMLHTSHAVDPLPPQVPIDTRVPRSQLRTVTRYYPELGLQSPFEIHLPLSNTAVSSSMPAEPTLSESVLAQQTLTSQHQSLPQSPHHTYKVTSSSPPSS